MSRLSDIGIALIAAALFVITGQWKASDITVSPVIQDHVVIPATIQVAMYGGDRYLASNIEMIRAAALGAGIHENDMHYLVRTHLVVAQLNPCHEDNYYLGNALLSWGGAVHEGAELLRRATECRFWDEYPPFFSAITHYFFDKDITEAQRNLEIAARRATGNAAAYRKLAVMIGAEELDDDQLALDYLRQQRDHAADPKLRQMLDKRVIRLEGLILLREAQQRYVQLSGRALESPEQLLTSGLLESLPPDPLRLGYTFENGEFTLRNIKIMGLERE
jgi:hypothetical protein